MALAPVAQDGPAALAGDAAAARRLQQAAEDFTAVALKELLQPMFDTADQSNGLFGGGAAERAFAPMMVDDIARQIARQGGLGLTEAVRAQMLRLQETKR